MHTATLLSVCTLSLAGLNIALNLLKPIAKKYPDVSYADLFQMASAAAVEVHTHTDTHTFPLHTGHTLVFVEGALTHMTRQGMPFNCVCVCVCVCL